MSSVPEVGLRRLTTEKRREIGLGAALAISFLLITVVAGGFMLVGRFGFPSAITVAASAPPPTGSYDPSRDPANPEFFAWYLVSDTPHVLVWRDGDALKEGIALIADGTAKKSPSMVTALLACYPDSGTRVANVSGGFFSSTVLVEEGRWQGCRGVVQNDNLSKKRPSNKKD